MAVNLAPRTGMGETFYSALGVATDATADAIRAAYRDRVKESHPDVSDDPDAPRQFKRLTAARDVLTDADERARYDRLGHATYVSRHVETSAWSVPDGRDAGGRPRGSGPATDAGAGRARPGESGAGGASSGSRSGRNGTGRRTRGRRPGDRRSPPGNGERHRRADAGGYDRSAWLGEDWDGPKEPDDRTRRAGRSARGTGWVGAPGWSREDTGPTRGSTDSTRDESASTDRGHGRSDHAGQRGPGAGPTAGPEATRRETGPDPAAERTDGAGAGAVDESTAAGRGAANDAGGRRDDSVGVGQPWQQASAAYGTSPSAVPADSTPSWKVAGRNLRALGPWIVIHIVLFVGAVAMAWYLYVGTAGVTPVSVPAVAFGILLVGLVVFLSILHLVSMFYA